MERVPRSSLPTVVIDLKSTTPIQSLYLYNIIDEDKINRWASMSFRAQIWTTWVGMVSVRPPLLCFRGPHGTEPFYSVRNNPHKHSHESISCDDGRGWRSHVPFDCLDEVRTVADRYGDSYPAYGILSLSPNSYSVSGVPRD